MVVANVGSWSNTWATSSSTPAIPVNGTLNIPVTGITGGNWLVATVGWQSVPGIPSSISVGDDAANYWTPIITSPTDPTYDSFALNANWNFATGVTTPWTLAAGSSLSISTSTVYGSDSYSGQVTPNGSSSTAGIVSDKAVMQLQAGLPVSASAFARFTQAVTSAFSLVISFYDGTSTLISSVTGTPVSAAAKTWTMATNTTIAPSGTVFAALTVQLTGTPATTNVFNVARAKLYSPIDINYNPFFANTPPFDGWVVNGATVTSVTNITLNGMQAMQVTPTGLSSNVSVQSASGVYAPVTPFNYYTGLGWIFSPTGYNQAGMKIRYYDSTKTLLTTSSTGNIAVTPDGWARVDLSSQAPASAKYASVALTLANNPKAWDVFYVADVGLKSAFSAFSSVAQCSIWAAPNINGATTQVFVQPLGQVQGVSATISEYSGMPTWLTVDTVAATYVTESSLARLTLTPTQNDLVILAGASTAANIFTFDRVSLSGWAPHFWDASAFVIPSSVSSFSSFEVASWQTTANPATSTMYGVAASNKNPVYAAGVAGWTTTNATFVSSSAFTWPYSGIDPGLVTTKSGLLTPNGTSSACNVYNVFTSGGQVVPNLYYLADFYLYSPPGWTNYQLQIIWLTSSFTSLSVATGPQFSAPANTWTNTVFEAQAPSGAFWGVPVLIQNGTPPTSAVTYVGRGTFTAANTFIGQGQAQAMAAFQLTPTVPSVVTQSNSTWPLLRLEVAFGQNASTLPNLLQWTDISSRLLSANIQQGRQYELNALQAGVANLRLRNDDGFLTPNNPASPYNCQVFNPIRITAIWQNKIYGIFSGYMERWPAVWTDPHWGEINAVGVDTYALFSKTLQNMIREEILLDKPVCYWPCNDNSAAQVALNIGSQSTKTPLAISLATNSVNAFNGFFGDSTLGYGGTNYAISPTSSSVNTSLGQPLVYGGLGVPVGDNLPPAPFLPSLGGNGVTIILFTGLGPFKNGASSQVTSGHISLFTAVGNSNPIFEIWLDGSYNLNLTTWNVNTGAQSTGFITGPFDTARNNTLGTSNDAVIAITVQQGLFFLYVNNAYGNFTNQVVPVQESWNNFEVLGRVDPFISTARYGYIAVNNIAIYDRILPLDRIAAIMNSRFGAINDYGDYRVNRLLSYQQATQARIYNDIRSAQTQLTGAYDQAGLNVGSAINNVAVCEAAFTYIDRNGYFVYRARQNATDRGIQATFGENTAAGEVPYMVTLEIDFDPSYVYNDVQVTYIGSPNPAQTQALAGTVTSFTDAASIAQYGDRSLSVSQYVLNAAQVSNLGNYLLNQYKQPMQRVARVLVQPIKNPTSFSTLLALDVGDRIVLNRRPVGANAIALTVTIIGIAHDIDWAAGKWDIHYDIMPQSISALQTVTLTFDIAGLDVLDSSNVIGW